MVINFELENAGSIYSLDSHSSILYKEIAYDWQINVINC